MKRFLLFALAVIMFAACSKDAINEQQNMQTIVDEAPETLTVGFEGDETRIQLNEAQKTVWTNGDLVSVFYKSDANQKYEYRGETGERTAELHKVSAGSSTTKMGYVVVAYPYNEEYIISPASGNLETMLPAVQHYAVDSYGVGDNLMVSCSEFTQFSLKSVCGWLKLQLTGNGEKVKSITLRGNNGEQVAGLIHVDTKSAEATLYSEEVAPDDNGNANGSLVIDDAMVTELTLDCGEGVALGKEATAFYIALPPQTFENGLTIEIEDIDALKMTKSTDKAVIIERNTIQPMTSFEVDVKPVLSDYYITTEFDIDTPGKELHYVNDISKMVNEGNVLVNIDYGDGSFGKTVPHRYDKTGRYTVKFYFDSPITEIVDYAFYNSRVCSVEIPASVTQLGYMSFNSSSLEDITYEKNSSLKIIEGMAFANCRSLESFIIPSSVESIGECVLGGCTSLKDIKNSSSKYMCGYLGQDDAPVLHENGSVLKIIAYTAGNTTEDLSCIYLSVDIGWGAFLQCPYIKTVDLVNITNIEQVNFYFCDNLESIRLVETAHIANNVLSYCDKLEAVDAPDAAFIGEDTFCNNKSMAYIKLGSDKLTTISRVGNNNENLNTVHIPSGVESIANSFNGNAMLAEVYCKATTPPALTDSFDSIPENATLYVPADSVNVYKSAEGWSKFAIVGYDFENGEIVEVQPNNEIWYTSSDGNVVTPYKTDVFGANIVSNTYDSEKGCWVIKFDGDVTTIGERAFYYYKSGNIETVFIPNSVETIEEKAFYGCNRIQAFYGKFATKDHKCLICDSTLVAFANGCQDLEYTLPTNITRIGHGVFYKTNIQNTIHIPDSVISIGVDAFWGSENIKEIVIPDSVQELGAYSFATCKNLVNVKLSSNLKILDKYMFQECTSLSGIEIPNGVETIGIHAFYGCSKLKNIKIPSSVKVIQGYAFYPDSPYSTRTLYIDNLTSWSKINFVDEYSNPQASYLFVNNEPVSEIIIPNDVTSIKSYAYGSFSSIENIIIPESVSEIDARAFYHCYAKNITINGNINKIGIYAFGFCAKIESITLPNTVEYIADCAFYNCSNLTSVYCKATTPPALGDSYVFDYNDSGRTIYVPAESVEIYKSAEYWSEYASAIVGYDFENGVVVE